MLNDRTTLTVGGIVLAIVLFLSLNIFAGGALTGARLDMTENRLFTLSDGTRGMLADLREPVVLRLYVSDGLTRNQSAIAPYAQRVREVLRRYVDLSGGMLTLEVLRPEPFSDLEDRARAFGVQGIALDDSGDLAYFGLAATNSTDDEEIIPFFDPGREAWLEYDLTRLIYGLAHPEKTRIGIVTTLPMQGDFRRQTPPWALVDQMKQFFEVTFLDTALTRVPDDVDILMIAHPQGLSDATLFAIDQYVLGGGKAMIFVDPHSEISGARPGPQGQPNIDTASDLAKILSAWKIDLDTERVVADMDNARQVRAQDAGRPVVTAYPAWIRLGTDAFAPDDLATAQLELINLASAGSLKVTDGAGVELLALLTSSANSQLVPSADLRARPDPLGLVRGFESGDDRHVLAARLKGPVETAFPDGAPEGSDWEGDISPGATLAGNVILFADSDLLADMFWVRTQSFAGERLYTPIAHNGDMVLNLLDQMSGGAELVDLRGRGLSARPFIVIERLRQEAEQRYRAEEQALLTRLDELDRQLSDSRTRRNDDGGVSVELTEAQLKALEDFRAEQIATRRQLRDVRRKLREAEEALYDRLRAINIFAVPGAMVPIALLLGLWRRARHRARAFNP